MTTLAASKRTPSPAGADTARAPGGLRATATWFIRGVEPGDGGATRPTSDLDRAATLRWTIERRNGACEARAELLFGDGADARTTALLDLRDESGERIAWIEDAAGRLTHVEVVGHAALTFRRAAPDDGGAWRLRYARTALLARLEVPGGRSEVTGTIEPVPRD